MNNQDLIYSAKAIGWHPVIDNNRAFIEIQCPSCSKQMLGFMKSRLAKEKVFKCMCNYRLQVNEEEYECLTGRCFLCEKRDCSASDHRFHGVIPGGMGL